MKKISLTLILLLCATLAAAHSVSFSPSPVSGVIYSSSIVLKVSTTSPLLCRYSQTQELSFDLMTTFQEPLRTTHKLTLTGLSNGVYDYYVKCRPIDDTGNASAETTQLVTFTISNPITAVITLSDSTLSAGKYEIALTTTKVPASTPLLKYSYDGITYTPIVLYGSTTSWKGFLVIPSSAGEKIGSFKFEARDIEGRSGSQIIGDSIFTVDTTAPPLMTSIEASGEYGEIKLEWFLDEDEEVEQINIYRSENPNVGLTDLYEEIDGDRTEYFDIDVENGKTYYYRFSLEDEAGNTASLSREIRATSLLSATSTSTSTSGLSPELLGSVDALLSEIILTETEIQNSNEMIASLTETEREYAKAFRITDSLQSAKSELGLLKRTVEGYKLTDITKEALDGKLSSSQIKLNILKKKIPNTFTTIDSNEITFNPTEGTIRQAVLEYSPELTPSQIDKTVKKSLAQIEENNLKIKSIINTFETIYLDGSSSSNSILEHFLDSTLTKSENSKFILKLPSGSLDLSSLSIKNLDYSPEQEGLVSFETDVKKITYTFEQKLDPQILKEISISLIISQEESVPLTGYFLSEIPTQGSTTATLLILLASGLIGYLFFVKQQQRKEISLEFLEKAKQVKVLQKEGKTDEANKLYTGLKVEYLGLSKEQKSEVFKAIKHLTKK